MNEQIATGFDFEPLPDGNVLVEFFGDDGKTFNKQVIIRSCLTTMPVVATATSILIDHGKEAMMEFMDNLTGCKGRRSRPAKGQRKRKS